jgi:threonine dehydrogenase-like Zn-dependent dehydrogenase
MQQLTLVATRKIAWQDVAAPRLAGDGEALVRPLAVTRCDIDMPYVTGLLPPPRPFALGHECVGEIVALGDAVRKLRIGQRVVVPFQISCGACPRCQRGHTGSCERVPFLSCYGIPLCDREWGGALSETIHVPFAEAMLVPAPEGVPAWCLAAAADNASDGWRCVAAPLAENPGAAVLILAGVTPSIALYAADAALALGAARVDCVSQNAEVLRIAESLGAHAIDASWADVRGSYPITVDCSGSPEGIRLALRATDKEGVCTQPAWIPARETPIPLSRMYTMGATLHVGRCHARATLPPVVAAIAAGRLHPEKITTRRAAWADAAEAMAESAVKLVLDREAAR